MVTFVCSHCDATLKKKQTEKHTFGRCRPASFICIDCHVTFQGNDYKKHISCLTQFEKHWGEYAKPKQVTQNKGQDQKNGDGVQANKVEKKEQVAPPAKTIPEVVVDNNDENGWKGWKNELKEIIKDNNKNISLESLEKIAIKRFREFSQEDEKDQELREIIKDKVSKLKKVKLVAYVTLE